MLPLDRVTVFCFAASYGVALGLEIWRLARPRVLLRIVSIAFGAAGLFAHLIYLVMQAPPLVSSNGSLLFLAFVLGIFWFYGSLHHQRVAWGVFVLPLVLGLIGMSQINPMPASTDEPMWEHSKLMPWTHGMLLLLAAVGICVGFLASVMYFVQVYRLRSKTLPGQGLKLMSLERLEEMNRRAILWAFPLLTIGLIVGLVIQVQQGEIFKDWLSPKILSTLGLWLVFAILLFLRYGAHVRGKKVALMTIVAFAVLLVALGTAHPFLGEVSP